MDHVHTLKSPVKMISHPVKQMKQQTTHEALYI